MPPPLHHHQPASTPLPLAISVEDGWQIMEPPSRSFIGPMPAVPKPDFLAGDGGMPPDTEMLPEKSLVASKPQDPSVQMMSRSATTAIKTPADTANLIQAAMTGSKVAADLALQSVQSVQAAAMSGEQTRTARAYNDAVQASSAGNSSAAEGPAAASSGGGQSSSGGGNGGGAQHQAAQAVDGFGARDASGRMVVHRLNTERHGWAGTMVRQLDAGLKNGTQSIRIILQPGNLGRLNVDLGLRNGAAHIRVGAESAEAAQLLKGARHHLSQMLEQSGMRLAGLQTVNIGGEGASEGGLGQGGHGQHEAAGENSGRKQAFSNKMQQPDGVDATQTGDADAQDLLPRAGENAVLSILA
jgi:flagellar hook-length control protein FliK